MIHFFVNMEQKFMSTWNTYHVNVFMNMISCLQTTYHVNVVMNTISGLHDMRFMNMLTWYGSCVQTYCFMCEWYVSCWRILVVQDHVFKSCTVDDHIVNTWWILWKHGWWVPYHLYISCTMLMLHWAWVTWLISWTHDTVTSCVVTKTYHVSCVVTKAGLSCVCVCVQHNLRPMLVSLQLFKDTTWCHWHMITFLGRKVIQMEKSWVSGRPAVGIPALLGLGWDTSFRLPWLG